MIQDAATGDLSGVYTHLITISCLISRFILPTLASVPTRYQLTHRPLWDLNKILVSNMSAILVIDGISHEIALKWISQYLTENKSTLLQVMAWCNQQQAITQTDTDESIPPYGVNRPQCVKIINISSKNTLMWIPHEYSEFWQCTIWMNVILLADVWTD